MRRLLITLVTLVVLVVLLDRGGDLAAEQVAASSLQDSQGLSDRPSVSIDGIPFLTQFAQGHYGHITVRGTAVPVGSADLQVDLSTLRIDLRDVRVDREFSRFRVARATARATIDYAELGDRLGATVSYAGDGKLRASKDIDVLGQTISPEVTVEPALSDGVLTFAGAQIGNIADGFDSLPASVQSAIESIFGDIELTRIPFDIEATRVRADTDGLEITLTGRNLRYARP